MAGDNFRDTQASDELVKCFKSHASSFLRIQCFLIGNFVVMKYVRLGLIKCVQMQAIQIDLHEIKDTGCVNVGTFQVGRRCKIFSKLSNKK